MATTTPGNAITGNVGITCWADTLMTEGLLVAISGDYKVGVPSAGSTAILGHVIKGNLDTGAVYGNLTVEAYGHGVVVATAGGAVAAGALVKTNNAGKWVTGGTGSDVVGLALTAASGANALFDVLTFR